MVWPFQYADELLLVIRGKDITAFLTLFKMAVEMLIPWLKSLGFYMSLPESQLCVFKRGRLVLEDISLTIEDYVFACQATLLYLGILLDMRRS